MNGLTPMRICMRVAKYSMNEGEMVVACLFENSQMRLPISTGCIEEEWNGASWINSIEKGVDNVIYTSVVQNRPHVK